MPREKQIDEIAREMCHLSAECKTCQICNEKYNGGDDDDELCYFQCVAKEIINHGYRKQSEGEWIAKEKIIRSITALNYTCSVCGVDGRYTPYCPNCGAKMDGEREEGNDNG